MSVESPWPRTSGDSEDRMTLKLLHDVPIDREGRLAVGVSGIMRGLVGYQSTDRGRSPSLSSTRSRTHLSAQEVVMVRGQEGMRLSCQHYTSRCAPEALDMETGQRPEHSRIEL